MPLLITIYLPLSLSVSIQTKPIFTPPILSSMGAHLCSTRRSPASGDGYAICGWRRLQWWRREKIEVKTESEASIEKKEMKNEYMSLEELLFASPGPPSERGFGNGGEFNVLRHGGFKRKVHPTRISNSSSFCERSGVVGESVAKDEYSRDDFSICRSESGKLRKKVSFRLPEVSDVIVIYSPEEDATADDGNIAS